MEKESTIIPGVYQRGENKYRIEIYLGSNQNGEPNRYRKTVTLKDGLSKKEIKEQLTQLKLDFSRQKSQEQTNDSEINSTSTLTELTNFWVETYAKNKLEPSTLKRYEQLLDRILSRLGAMRLCDIKASDINKFYNYLENVDIRNDLKYIALPQLHVELKKKKITPSQLAKLSGLNMASVNNVLNGKSTMKSNAIAIALGISRDKIFEVYNRDKLHLSTRTVLHHHRVLNTILEFAVKWDFINSNPARKADTPRVKNSAKDKGVNHYDKNTLAKVLLLLENESIKHKAFMYTAIYTGCRAGELVGLEWDAINFDSKTLTIRQSAQRMKGKTNVKSPKTKSGNRVIPISKALIDVLEEYRDWQQGQYSIFNENKTYEGYIFTQSDFTIMYPTTPSGWWRMFIKKHNLPHLSFHGLRHTHATLLIESGTSVNVVASRLGHSRISTTTDTYCHTSNDASEKAAETFGNIFE